MLDSVTVSCAIPMRAPVLLPVELTLPVRIKLLTCKLLAPPNNALPLPLVLMPKWIVWPPPSKWPLARVVDVVSPSEPDTVILLFISL
jgi:hypothetical protein